MKHYKQLTRVLRYQIYGLKPAGLNQTEIAQKTGVDKGTISREFKRNAGKNGAARSRKVLGFRTPHEVFFGMEIRYTKQPLAVSFLT